MIDRIKIFLKTRLNVLINSIMGLFALIVPTVLTIIFKDPTFGLLALFSIFAATILFNFENIKGFSVLGLKAELEEKIREADVTLKQVRELSMAFSRSSLAEMMSSYIFDGISIEEKMKLKNRVLESLKSLNLNADEISDIETEWRQGIRYLFFIKLSKKIKDLNPDAGREVTSLMHSREWANTPSPTIIENIIDIYELKSRELMVLLKDYKHFEDTNELMHPKRLE